MFSWRIILYLFKYINNCLAAKTLVSIKPQVSQRVEMSCSSVHTFKNLPHKYSGSVFYWVTVSHTACPLPDSIISKESGDARYSCRAQSGGATPHTALMKAASDLGNTLTCYTGNKYGGVRWKRQLWSPRGPRGAEVLVLHTVSVRLKLGRSMVSFINS